MIIVNNPFGQDLMDFNEDTAADRIGRRIRTIRETKGMSQAELGEKVGLSADRIQKYENGARRPKPDMTKTIANALDVQTSALTDPVVSNYYGAMFAFFEMEDLYGLHLDHNGKFTLSFGNGISGTMNDFLSEWHDARQWYQNALSNATSKEEQESIRNDYQMWKWRFPKALTDRTERMLRRERLQRKIEELQEELDSLEELE